MTRPPLLLALALALALLASPRARPAPAPVPTPPERWHLLFKGRLVSVHVERALYEPKPGTAFALAFRVTNLTPRPVSIDLRSPRQVLSPNQWGALTRPRRELVNERRTILPPLDDKAKGSLTAAHRAGALTTLRPAQALTFYRSFNGQGNKQAVRRAGGSYLFVSVAGQLLVTDGKDVERVNCSFGGRGRIDDTDVILPCPVLWKALPKGAVLVGEPDR